MNGSWLTSDEQRRVCEDLLLIEQVGRMEDVWSLRRQMLRDHRPPEVWMQIVIDRLAKQAASLIGGSPGCWREAAAAALGAGSRVDVCIEAVCRVAEDVRWREPQPKPPVARLSINSRKRGGR
jgi:hypothetical protein